MLILLLGIGLLFLILGLFATTGEYCPPDDRKSLLKKFKHFCYNHELFGMKQAVIQEYIAVRQLPVLLLILLNTAVR